MSRSEEQKGDFITWIKIKWAKLIDIYAGLKSLSGGTHSQSPLMPYEMLTQHLTPSDQLLHPLKWGAATSVQSSFVPAWLHPGENILMRGRQQTLTLFSCSSKKKVNGSCAVGKGKLRENNNSLVFIVM